MGFRNEELDISHVASRRPARHREKSPYTISLLAAPSHIAVYRGISRTTRNLIIHGLHGRQGTGKSARIGKHEVLLVMSSGYLALNAPGIRLLNSGISEYPSVRRISAVQSGYPVAKRISADCGYPSVKRISAIRSEFRKERIFFSRKDIRYLSCIGKDIRYLS